jgi:hypothetical protein
MIGALTILSQMVCGPLVYCRVPVFNQLLASI